MGKGFKKLIRECIDPELAAILRKHRITEKFINNTYNNIKKLQYDYAKKNEVSVNNKYLLYQARKAIKTRLEPRMCVIVAFYWRDTPEGYSFWDKIDLEYRERLEQLR